MRLLYLWQSRYPWEIRVQKITESLSQAGHAVTVLARKTRRSDPDEETLAHQVGVMRLGAGLSLPVSGSPVWSRALHRAIAQTKAEVLIVRELPLLLNAVRVAKEHGIPLVMDMAEHYPGAMRSWKKYRVNPVARLLIHGLRLPDLLERWGVPQVDLIWVVCQEQAERLHRDYGIPFQRIVEVRNTPGLAWFHGVRRGASNPPRVLGHHGAMTPERGLEILIDAFASVSAQFPDLTLELAGDGETTLDVRNRIRRLGVESRIRLLGRYRYSDLDELYSRIDLAVLPYPPGDLIDNTLSNKIFDYLACGKPLITSGAAPMKRVVRETQSGVFFEPWTADALAKAIRNLLTSVEINAMCENGRRAFETKYHWEADAERMTRSLESIIRVPAASRMARP